MGKSWIGDFAVLVLSTGMVTVGYLGLIGEIRKSKYLIAALLATMVILSFSLGRQSTQLDTVESQTGK